MYCTASRPWRSISWAMVVCPVKSMQVVTQVHIGVGHLLYLPGDVGEPKLRLASSKASSRSPSYWSMLLLMPLRHPSDCSAAAPP